MAAPCIECGRRSKALPRQRCAICLLRHEPIGEQIREARRRREMVPAELRPRLTKAMREATPAGTRYCASCCSYRDEADFHGAKHTQCYACRSERSHAAMTKRVYGLSSSEYTAIEDYQDGRCAICGNRPKKKRLVVDHRHSDGVVRGLLCGGSEQSGCNFALGLFHDDPALLWRAYVYLTTPPTEVMERWVE